MILTLTVLSVEVLPVPMVSGISSVTFSSPSNSEAYLLPVLRPRAPVICMYDFTNSVINALDFSVMHRCQLIGLSGFLCLYKVRHDELLSQYIFFLEIRRDLRIFQTFNFNRDSSPSSILSWSRIRRGHLNGFFILSFFTSYTHKCTAFEHRIPSSRVSLLPADRLAIQCQTNDRIFWKFQEGLGAN